MKTLAAFFTALGWTRDDWKWIWGQWLGAAAAICSGLFDLHYWGEYVGLNLTLTEIHIITVLSVVSLWISGKMDSSHLSGVPKPPVNPDAPFTR